ncbi:hypothetical protein Q4512_07780 [Oceanihabitans sp. 2_MG-2023]|uniref:hypothetical protein n=1 Tax=Oceanihabitans sp. 2_MG-2023 TaxID=3062661 RepID=UPI0026E49009|nr:hypothetical protein [Oceanihabitans sp. 2_MG-2023]MDO6596812.1 hypothetical protein [Oceanihabitans sp. 2_MG-2023]
MKPFQEHSVFKLLSIILIVTLLTPSLVKVGHVFENHKHDVCTDNLSQTHLHALDLDCEFYKFKLNTKYYTVLNNFRLSVEENFSKINNTFYYFLNNHQQLSFSLRGPPSLV